MNPGRAHLRIHGFVQGVSYRTYACDEALRLGLTGWVRNHANGDVEAVAEGAADALESFVRWCRTGPSDARVESIERIDAPATGEFRSFSVTR